MPDLNQDQMTDPKDSNFVGDGPDQLDPGVLDEALNAEVAETDTDDFDPAEDDTGEDD